MSVHLKLKKEHRVDPGEFRMVCSDFQMQCLSVQKRLTQINQCPVDEFKYSFDYLTIDYWRLQDIY